VTCFECAPGLLWDSADSSDPTRVWLRGTGSDDRLWLGLWYDNEGYNTDMATDEFRVWNRMLTAEELWKAYALHQFSTDKLIVYHSFNEQKGNVIHNLALTGYDVGKVWSNDMAGTWEKSYNALCLPEPKLRGVRIMRDVDGVEYLMTPGFDASVFDYAIIVPLSATRVRLSASWLASDSPNMHVTVSGPTGVGGPSLCYSQGHSTPSRLLVPDLPISFLLNPGSNAPNIITLRSGSDGNVYSFTISRPCGQGQSDNGHLYFDGTRSVQLTPTTDWTKSLTAEMTSVHGKEMCL
jgi:hypothetical protein